MRRFPSEREAHHIPLAVATRKLAETYNDLHGVISQIGSDRTLNEAARLVRQASLARTRLAPALGSLGSARNDARSHLAELGKLLDRPFDLTNRPYAEIVLGSEIRSHFRTLPPKDRHALLQGAMEDRDLGTLIAFGSVPPFLSGFAPELIDRAKSVVQDVMAPGVREQRARLSEAEGFAGQIEETVMQSVANAVDFASADAIEASMTSAA